MSDPDHSLDADVRRAEPDFWLASRLVADPARREGLIALVAVHAELAKVAGVAANPLAGEIRLAWWREEIEALFAGDRALGRPALQALRGIEGLDQAALEAMVEARHAELEARPFEEEAKLLAYLDGIYGALMRQAATLLAPAGEAKVAQAARAYGWARLGRERPAWRARGRDWTPVAWDQTSDDDIAAHLHHRVTEALDLAQAQIVALPVAAFPAIAPAALARLYVEGRRPNDLEKRLRLLWASLRGKV
jgi:phytoene synthase